VRTGIPFRRWLLLPISIVLVAVPFTFTTHLWEEIYQGPLLADLSAAHQRWETHPIAHYLMTIEREQAARRKCRQRIEVLEEKIARVLDNNCSTPLMTVTDLFVMLKQNLAPDDCAGDACKCMKPYRVSPLYDKQRGYPSMTLLVPIQSYAEPADAEFWGQAPGMNRQMDCTLSSPLMYETITVTELKPLP
jgi:hypothetical protein